MAKCIQLEQIIYCALSYLYTLMPISPFNVENAAIEAGRIMLHRIDELLGLGEDFAIETTLSAKSYVSLTKKAQSMGYTVTLLYIWLSSPEMAMERVAERVSKGGHNIPIDVIKRRYIKGIRNFFHLFTPVCDSWYLIDNSMGKMAVVASKKQKVAHIIQNIEIWELIQKQAYGPSTGE